MQKNVKFLLSVSKNVQLRAILVMAILIGFFDYGIGLFLEYFAIHDFWATVIDTSTVTIAAALILRFFFLSPYLKAVQEKQNSILNSLAEGLVYQTVTGEIIYHNESALKILGLSAEQLEGKKSTDPDWGAFREDLSPFPGTEHPSMIALKTGQNQMNVVMGVKKPGQAHCWIKINAIPQFSEHDSKTPNAVICTFADITSEKNIQRKIEDLNDRMTTASDGVGFGVWDWNLKNSNLTWDPIMYKIFQIDPKDFSSDYNAFERTLLKEDALDVQKQLQSVFEKKSPLFKSHFRILTKAGAIKHISAAAKCFYDGSGQIERLVGYNWDVTDEMELLSEHDRLHRLQSSILSTTENIIISLDINGKVTLFNHAAETLLDYTAFDMLGKTLPPLILMNSENLETSTSRVFDLRKILEDLRDQNSSHPAEPCSKIFEGFLLRKNGTEFPVRVHLTLMKLADDHAFGFLLMATDLSEEKKNELAMKKQQLLLTAQIKMASLGEMAAGIAHEINNPLAIIRGRATQLRKLEGSDPVLNSASSKYIDSIIATTDRIGKIISGLRNFSRSAENDPLIPTEITQLVDETLSLCQERFKNANISLTVEGRNSYYVLGRSTQLSQVLLNLLNNSFDAICNDNEKWVKVEIAKRSEIILSLSVTDSGHGIPASVAEKIMNPFFTTKEVGKGTGLGLSLSKGIIEDHGGLLYLDTHSKNTRFVIELQLDPAMLKIA